MVDEIKRLIDRLPDPLIYQAGSASARDVIQARNHLIAAMANLRSLEKRQAAGVDRE